MRIGSIDASGPGADAYSVCVCAGLIDSSLASSLTSCAPAAGSRSKDRSNSSEEIASSSHLNI